MKNKAGLYLGLIIFLVAIGMGGYLLNFKLTSQNAAQSVEKSSNKLNNEILKLRDVPALLKGGYTGIIYIGYESCPYCQEVKPIVYECKSNYSVNFKYIKLKNKNNDRLYTDKDKKNVYTYFEDYMDKNDDGTYTIYSPLVVSVKEGEILDVHLSTVDGHDASKAKMTDSQKAKLEDIINAMFVKLESSN